MWRYERSRNHFSQLKIRRRNYSGAVVAAWRVKRSRRRSTVDVRSSCGCLEHASTVSHRSPPTLKPTSADVRRHRLPSSYRITQNLGNNFNDAILISLWGGLWGSGKHYPDALVLANRVYIP